MAKVIITCDRCHEPVEGILTPYFTAGFYNVSQPNAELRQGGGCWAKYGKEHEDYICDHCMWRNPEYQRDYHYDSGMQLFLEEENGPS